MVPYVPPDHTAISLFLNDAEEQIRRYKAERMEAKRRAGIQSDPDGF